MIIDLSWAFEIKIFLRHWFSSVLQQFNTFPLVFIATPQAVFESDKLPEVPEDTQSKIEWMKNNLEPAGQVKDYMSTTVTYRRDWLKNKDRTVAAILQEFPRLLDKNMVRSGPNFMELLS